MTAGANGCSIEGDGIGKSDGNLITVNPTKVLNCWTWFEQATSATENNQQYHKQTHYGSDNQPLPLLLERAVPTSYNMQGRSTKFIRGYIILAWSTG
jgi:hypothetical protein